MGRGRKVAFFAAIGTALHAGEARAVDEATKTQCLDTYVTVQHQRDAGQFLEARAGLALCARDPCPVPLHADCSRWLAEVDRLVPSVVFQVRGARDEDIAATRVLVDGRVALDHLDGRPVELDPGAHVFRFELPGREPIERRVVIQAGEKARPVEVTVAAAVAAPLPREASSARPFPWLAATLAGVSLLGAAGMTYFGVTYLSERDAEDCRPRCTPDDEQAARRKALIADVSAAVFFVAGGLAAWLFVTRPDARRPASVGLAF
jgi:hypothetical protein